MRTTLDIDDDVLRASKELARQQSITAGAAISRLLRQALLQGGVAPVKRTPTTLGFRPFASRGRVVSDADVNAIRGAEDI